MQQLPFPSIAINIFLGGDFGYGSAVSVILFIIAFVLSIVLIKLGRFHDEVLT